MTKKFLLLYISGTLGAQHAFKPRDVSTDSMLELALVNYHRYHALETSNVSFYPKPFFIGARHHQRTIAGLLLTGYGNLTNAMWLGINAAAMVTKMRHKTSGGLDDIQFKLGFDALKLED